MKMNRKAAERLASLLAGCALGLPLGSPPQVCADLSAPDNILYGTVVVGTNPVTAGATGFVVEVRRTNGLPVARYRMGDRADAGNFYTLAIKLEELTPRRDASSVMVNEALTIVVVSNSVEQVQQTFTLAERGQVTRLDLGTLPTNALTGFEAWAFSLGLGLNSQDLDADGDGVPNFNEYVVGTHPTDATSKFLLRIAKAPTHARVSFDALQAEGMGYAGLNRHYALERLSNPDTGNWEPVPGYSDVVGVNQVVVHDALTTAERHFFRGRVWLQTVVEKEFHLTVSRDAGMMMISFPTLGQDAQGRNRYYTLEHTSDLSSGFWTAVPGVSNILGNSQTVIHPISNTINAPGFYRGRLELRAP